MTAIDPFTPDEFGSFVAGWLEGYDTHAALVSNWLAGTPQARRQSTQDELARARQCDNEPCRTRCRRCSRCSRYEAAWRNQRRYGSPDYPGVLHGDLGVVLDGDHGDLGVVLDGDHGDRGVVLDGDHGDRGVAA